MVQYEQYEQEVKDLQGRIEEAHRVIQDRPIPSNNIQELQAQILHHEVKHARPVVCALWSLKEGLNEGNKPPTSHESTINLDI